MDIPLQRSESIQEEGVVNAVKDYFTCRNTHHISPTDLIEAFNCSHKQELFLFYMCQLLV